MTGQGPSNDDPEASGRLLFALALLAGALLRLVLLGKPELFGPDEGIWAVAARNVEAGGLGQLLAPSNTPLGAPSGAPGFFPGLLAVMVSIFGAEEWAIRLPSVFAGLVGAFVLERIVRRGYGQPAGHLAGAFAALLPPLVSASRAAAVEPTLVALGLGGIIFGLRAFEDDSPTNGVLSGALFGLGFLTKGYAVGLFVLPLLAALAVRRDLLGLGKTRRTLAFFGVSLLVVGGSHLAAAALLSPSALGLLVSASFGASPLSRIALADPTAFGADLKSIVKTLFLFLPLAGLGAAFLARPRDESEFASGATDGDRRLSHGALWGVYGVELLVVVLVAGRVQLSSIPVLPAIAAFAGFGACAALRPRADAPGRRRERNVAFASGAAFLAVALFLVALPDDPLFGGRGAWISAGAALGLVAATALGAAFLAAGSGAARLGGRLALLFLAGLLVAAGIGAAWQVRRDLLTHAPGTRPAADQVAPLVAERTPEEASFRAPDPYAFSFRLFRTGRTWSGVTSVETFERDAATSKESFWALRPGAPAGPAAPPMTVVRHLESAYREVTRDVEARAGRKLELRVFVRR